MMLLLDLMEAYIADSESSSIRAVDLKTGGSRLLAGGDPIFPDNLFKVILIQFIIQLCRSSVFFGLSFSVYN